MSNLQKYWLISGQVVYVSQESKEEGVNVLPINAVHTTLTDYLTVKDINQIQRALQQQAGNRLSTPVEFLDAHINSVSPLGYMTDEQFKNMPETGEVAPEAPQEPAPEETPAPK